jgi:hypothetical protein
MRARRDIRTTNDPDLLRAAQAVLMPIEFGMTLAQTAMMIGRSVSWIAQTRSAYISGKLRLAPKQRGGRRNQLMPSEEEQALFLEALIPGPPWDQSVPEKLRGLIEQRYPDRLPEGLPDSTLYKILTRCANELIPGSNLNLLSWGNVVQILSRRGLIRYDHDLHQYLIIANRKDVKS